MTHRLFSAAYKKTDPRSAQNAARFWRIADSNCRRAYRGSPTPIGSCLAELDHCRNEHSALAQWFRARTENARGTRKPMIVALARKLLIALWRLVRQGVVPDGVVLRPTQRTEDAERTPTVSALSVRL